MRRMKTYSWSDIERTGIPHVIRSEADDRLMRAGMRALEKIANTPSPECARDPFLCKSLARQALDAFNRKRKP